MTGLNNSGSEYAPSVGGFDRKLLAVAAALKELESPAELLAGVELLVARCGHVGGPVGGPLQNSLGLGLAGFRASFHEVERLPVPDLSDVDGAGSLSEEMGRVLPAVQAIQHPESAMAIIEALGRVAVERNRALPVSSDLWREVRRRASEALHQDSARWVWQGGRFVDVLQAIEEDSRKPGTAALVQGGEVKATIFNLLVTESAAAAVDHIAAGGVVEVPKLGGGVEVLGGLGPSASFGAGGSHSVDLPGGGAAAIEAAGGLGAVMFPGGGIQKVRPQCVNLLRKMGADAVPRSCRRCGLGPCQDSEGAKWQWETIQREEAEKQEAQGS